MFEGKFFLIDSGDVHGDVEDGGNDGVKVEWFILSSKIGFGNGQTDGHL